MKTIMTAALYITLINTAHAESFRWKLSTYGEIGIETHHSITQVRCQVLANDSEPSHARDGRVVGFVELRQRYHGGELELTGVFPQRDRYLWASCGDFGAWPTTIIGAINISNEFASWWPTLVKGPSLTKYENRLIEIPATGKLTPGSLKNVTGYINVTVQSTREVNTIGWRVDPDLTIRGYIQGLVAGEYTVTLAVRVNPV